MTRTTEEFFVSGGSTRPLIPAGQYAARCCDVYSAGWWDKMDSTEQAEKIKVAFVLEVTDEEGVTETRYADLFETRSLNEKANLYKHLVAWRGKPFTSEELARFNLAALLGVPALVQITHKPKRDGGTRAIIGAIMALPKKIPAPDIPADYVRDKDREQPFASMHLKRETKPVVQRTAEEVFAEEDDDSSLPF